MPYSFLLSLSLFPCASHLHSVGRARAKEGKHLTLVLLKVDDGGLFLALIN